MDSQTRTLAIAFVRNMIINEHSKINTSVHDIEQVNLMAINIVDSQDFRYGMQELIAHELEAIES